MSEYLKRLLEAKQIGMISFDRDWAIDDIDQSAKTILASVDQSLSDRRLLAIFPELIGSESYVAEILDKKNDDLRLDYINRTDLNGNLKFLNLIILPADRPNFGLLVLEDVTQQALALQQINQQKYELFLYQHHSEFRRHFLSDSILGDSQAIRDLRETIHKVSRIPTTTVLLMGETGSGKNLAARVIHYSSMPVDAPFVEINCAALPEHLLESELFGYEKGAFTHAVAQRQGLLEEAQGGTIFLDEIGELPINMQAKLLHVLETKKFRRLGSNQTINVQSRIISATNRDLQQEVNRKKFREDLFYRLNVVSVSLPPLREMKEDVITIATHLLKIFNIEFKKTVNGFSDDAKQAMLNYPWPGNVRELSNCLERAMIFIEKDRIDARDLTFFQAPSPQTAPAHQNWTVPSNGIVLEDVERQLIISALELAHNNKSKAARLLGLTRDTLRYRLEKHQLE